MESRVLETLQVSSENIEVININFNIDTLEVTVIIDGDKLDVSFDSPVGFRVLDEGDLLEFWPECSSPNGWLHEIKSGGWFDLESNRGGFLSSDNADVKEYFIVGGNYCVSILAWEKPSVEQSTR